MASKTAADRFPDFDFGILMGGFPMPGLDIEALIDTQRRNVEALTQANRTAYEGMQAVMRRQAEILRQAMDGFAQLSRDMTEPGTAQDKAARQAELAKGAFEQTLASVREMTETFARSNAEACGLLNKRFLQSLEETREAFLAAGRRGR